MKSFSILSSRSTSNCARLLCAGLAFGGSSLAAVIVNDNGTWPDTPALQTFDRTDANVEAERDARFTRNLAQTFQTPLATKVDKLFLDYEEGLAGKEITIRIFTVADVNAGTLIQPETAGFSGSVLFNFVHTTGDTIFTSDAGNNPAGVLEIDLTEADEFTLPATTGTAGYAVQVVRSGAGSTSDTSGERAFKWHFNDNDNRYAGGRAYAVTGGGVDSADDFLFAISEVVLDTDGDTLPDPYEDANGLDKNNPADAAMDPDADGSTNLQEFQRKTNPQNPDTDNDGLKDGVETNTGAYTSATDTGTDPLRADTDGDALKDGVETNTGTFVSASNTGTNPFAADTDGDVYSDGAEVQLGSSPVNASSIPPATGLNLLAFWDFNTATEPTVTLDKMHNFAGQLQNGAVYTAEAGGRTGSGTDRAVDFGTTAAAGRGVYIPDAQWLNAAGVADAITVSYWQKWNVNIVNSSAFWFASPTAGSANAGRGRGAHAETPWGDANIPWDTGGATAGATRIIANISTFTSEAPNTFFSRWHHFAFIKSGGAKSVYIDGKLFNSGENPVFLATDFNEIFLGVEPDGTDNMRAVMDDFAVFGSAISEAHVKALAAGFSPQDLETAVADADGDGLPNFWEDANGFNKNNAADAAEDADADGLTNLAEYQNSTEPRNPDTDADGSNDGDEIAKTTNPLKPDTDGDGLKDGVETNTGTFVSASNTGTDPKVADTDGDAYGDGVEVTFGTSPVDIASIPSLGTDNKLFAYWNFDDAADPARTLDTIHGFVGNLMNGAVFTADAAGRSAKAGDRGMDFGNAGVSGRSVRSTDIAPYLQVAAAGNIFSISWWQKWNGAVANSSAVWWVSPSITTGGSRGLNSHVPYGNGTVYFDTGIGGGNNYSRISGNPMTTFDPTLNWAAWHHIALIKNGDTKEIWIDGRLFLSGAGPVLPTDLTELILGMDFSSQANTARIVMDDFAIYGTALDPEKIGLLAQGASPVTFGFPFNVTGVTYNAGTVSLAWESQPGKNYEVWRALAIDGTWSNIATVPAAATGSTTTFDDTTLPAGSPAAFYSIKQQ